MANRSSSLRGSAGGFTGIFHKVSSYAVTEVKHAVLEARDSIVAAVDKVDKVKNAETSSVAKNIRNWVQEHPWKKALVVVTLVALACTAIGLLVVGFTPGGIAAGESPG